MTTRSQLLSIFLASGIAVSHTSVAFAGDTDQAASTPAQSSKPLSVWERRVSVPEVFKNSVKMAPKKRVKSVTKAPKAPKPAKTSATSPQSATNGEALPGGQGNAATNTIPAPPLGANGAAPGTFVYTAPNTGGSASFGDIPPAGQNVAPPAGGGSGGGGSSGAAGSGSNAGTPPNSGTGNPPAPAPLGINGVMLPDGSVQLVDDDAGVTLMSPNKQALWAANGPGPGNASLQPQIAFTAQPSGFDVTYTFVNTSSSPKSPGVLYAPGIRFGQTIQTRAFSREFKTETIDHRGSSYFGGGDYYPHGLYSPVAVLSNGVYTIGVSLNYPVTEYNHAAFIRVESPGGQYTQGGRNWQVMMRLNPASSDPNDDRYNPQGDIPAGATRTYKVCLRVAKCAVQENSSDWLRTLAPYKQFFNATYGGANYTRDARPVCGFGLSDVTLLSADNPYGYDTGFRPDIGGWSNLVGRLTDLKNQGWKRWMLWAPSGMYKNHPELNYPVQFTSEWDRSPAIRNSRSVLAAFGATNQIGLWWGRSSQVMHGWDTGVAHWFDPNDTGDVNYAFNELDGAAAVNATTIGLDTFAAPKTGAWNAYRWLKRMQARYPNVKFIIEPRPADFLHSLAPTFVYGTRPREQARARVTEPFYMADFLMPGHETWATIDRNELMDELNVTQLSDVQIVAKVRALANLGFVPVLYCNTPIPSTITAAESWLTTVPDDIR